MIINCYKIINDEKLSEQLVSAKKIIGLIEENRILKNFMTEFKDIKFDFFINQINQKIAQYFPDLSNVEVDCFVVPKKILSLQHKNCICDGFAYLSKLSKNPTIVISLYTDTCLVLCHEICHILIKEVFPNSISCKGQIVESAVEFLEYVFYKESCLNHYEEPDVFTKIRLDCFDNQKSSIVSFLRKEFFHDS